MGLVKVCGLIEGSPLIRINLLQVGHCLALLDDVWPKRPLPILFHLVVLDSHEPSPIQEPVLL